MSTDNTQENSTINAVNSGLDRDEMDTFLRVKASGLSISTLDAKKEPCAYQRCKDNAIFCMEELLVCKAHAEKLLRCFISEK